MKFRLFSLVFLFSGLTASAQTFSWWNPARSLVNVIEGKGWPEESAALYDRFPARAEKTVPSPVWNLSHHAAGLMIRFRSNADQIVVRYGVGGSHAMPHMPATGVSGVDLYAVDADGALLWSAGKYAFKDTVTYRFEGLRPNDSYHPKGREYRLYLPLYNSVKWLEIGVPEGTLFSPLPSRLEKPIVVYGTSIAQGACASRPGMAWPAIVGRQLDRPVINLGFSGNGRMEKETVGLVNELDAKVFLVDCLPNLVASVNIPEEEIRKRYLEGVRLLRAGHPSTPIVIAEHSGYTEGGISPVRRQYYEDVNRWIREVVQQLKNEGITGLSLIPQAEFGQDIETKVDGSHPSDLGMMRYAEGYVKALREILNEPEGTIVTTRPVTQNRDAAIYDWQLRHRDVLSLAKTRKPKLVFLGNSITHYWSGVPQAPVERGKDAWMSVLEPRGAMNFGFGWDRIENVLWRVYHDELDGFDARQVVLLIGTNNLQYNSDVEITDGLKFLVSAVRRRQPRASVLVLGILPRRGQEARLRTLNEQVKAMATGIGATFADPGKSLLKTDLTIEESLFTDGLHPNGKGYSRIAAELDRVLLR